MLMASAPSGILPAFALAARPPFSPKLPVTCLHGSEAGQAAGGGGWRRAAKGQRSGQEEAGAPLALQPLLAWGGFSVSAVNAMQGGVRPQ